MSADFIRHKKCPLCDHPGCRESVATGLFFCHDLSVNPIDYIYRGQDQWGFGLWQHTTDARGFSQQASEDKEHRRREFLAAQERRRQQQIAQQMSPLEKDSSYRQLLAQLKLTESDRQRLLQRGFTDEQIVADGYRSVTAWQKVIGLSLRLPGILPYGSVNIHTDAILCPVRNKDGQLVGLQARLTDCMKGRYRWMTSATKKNPDGATPHVNGELPLGVYEPEPAKGSHESIWLIEGTAIKPNLACYRLSVPVVGASSGRFATSPETAKASVEYLSGKYATKLLSFAIDAGDVINTNGVPERWQEQFHFFKLLGYTCRVAWWGQITKEQDDIDELTDFSVITYITPEEFWAIVEEHRKEGAQTPPVATDSTTEAKTPSDWAWQQWIRSRKFTPDIILDQKEFEFPNLPEKNIIAAVNSGLGTGKTNAIIRLMKLFDYVRGMVVGYRNTLLMQTINRAMLEGLTLYHLREDDGVALLADVYTKLLFCLDSIHLVDGYFTGVDLYIDEIVSVLLHASGGGTLGENQAKALKIFTRALQVSNRVFILDGNLADIHVDFIAKLAPAKRVIKIKNQRKILPHNIKIVEGINDEEEIKKSDKSPLIQRLLQPDVIPWIFCDSKDRTKVLGKILSERGKVGYVLNSETSSEEWAKEFLLNANKFIEKYKPDFMILSPTAESGISVTVKNHFTDKFTFIVGVQGTNSQHQSMFRLRDETIPHYLFCPERSSVIDRSGPQTYSVQQFKEILNHRILQSGLLAAQSADNTLRASEIIAQAIAKQDDAWWELSCQLGALDHYEMNNLRKCLVHILEEAGHNVEIVKWDIDEGVKKLEKEAREAIQWQHAKEINLAEEYSSTEEAKKKGKNGAGLSVQRRVEKTFLLDRIPGIKENPIWGESFIYECYLKQKDFISQQQRFWMVQNIEISQRRHEAQWFYHATGEDFFSARVRRMDHDTIWALKELNICQFIGQRYNKDSPSVVQLIDTLRQRTDIQSALRKSIKPQTATGKERLEILSSLLSLIGYKNFGVGKRFVGKVRLMHYTAEPIFVKTKVEANDKPVFDFASARDAVMEAIASKFTSWMASEKAQISWEPEPESKPVEAAIPTPTPAPSPLELAVNHLQTLHRWDDMRLERDVLDKAWQLLTLQDQNRLTKLYETHKQIVEDDRYSMLTDLLPECEDGETVEQLVGNINADIVVTAVRSLRDSIRSKIASFWRGLADLFSEQHLIAMSG